MRNERRKNYPVFLVDCTMPDTGSRDQQRDLADHQPANRGRACRAPEVLRENQYAFRICVQHEGSAGHQLHG